MKTFVPVLLLNLLTCCLSFSAFAQYSGSAPFTPERGGIIINEISQGPSGGFSEYIEYVVVGNPDDPTAPVDISGWITDDNNFPASGEGNAAGHISFGDCYSAVPPGSIIVVFNNEAPNPLMPPTDAQDANNDGVYIIPHDDPCMNACPSNPTTSNGAFCPCANPSSDPTGWEHGLRNGGDVVQVRDACETVIHVIHWGNVALTLDISSSPVELEVGGSQSGRVILLTNNTDNNWDNPTNYENPLVTGNESPGAPNGTFNADFITSISDGTFPYEGVISDCRDTDAGDLVVPVDAPSDAPITLCQGNDIAAFTANYDLPDEFEPDAVGFAFEYAFILAQVDGTILDFNTTGDFDFSGLIPGTYLIYGFSYIQTNGSVSIDQFLDSFSNIQEILDYTNCGYNGDLSNLDQSGLMMEVNIIDSNPIVPVTQPLEECAIDQTNLVSFNLAILEQQITDGTGVPVNWYQDPNGTIPIADPSNYLTNSTAVYASTGSGVCESNLIEIVLVVHPFFSVILDQVEEVDCNGSSTAAIVASFDIGNPANPDYDWNVDAFDGSPNAIDIPAGTYSVIVSDGNGCTQESSIDIIEPDELTINCSELMPVSFFGGNDGVAEINHQGGTPPYNFTWNPNISGFDMTLMEGPFEVPNLIAGDYALTVTDANGCEAECTFTITEPDCSFELNVSSQNISCSGEQDGSIALEIIGGIDPITIEWSNGANSTALDGLEAGNYSVTVTDGAACFIIQEIEIIEPNPLSFDANPLDPTCFNTADGQITINSISGGTGPYFISSNGILLSETDGMTYIIGNLDSGEYQISIEDQNGCSTEGSFTIAEVPILSLELGSNQTVGLGQTVQLNPVLNFDPTTFQWIPPLYLNDSSALRPISTPEDDITYVFFAALSPDCFVTDSISITVDKTKKIYIPNAFSPNDDGFNDRFTIYSDISVRQVSKMRIFDRWGELVYENDDFVPNSEIEGWNGKFRDELLNPGVYVYVIEVEFIDGELQTYTGDVLLLK